MLSGGLSFARRIQSLELENVLINADVSAKHPSYGEARRRLHLPYMCCIGSGSTAKWPAHVSNIRVGYHKGSLENTISE